jgi:hypothetical protein
MKDALRAAVDNAYLDEVERYGERAQDAITRWTDWQGAPVHLMGLSYLAGVAEGKRAERARRRRAN